MRIPELDGLRGLAALGVVVAHAYLHPMFEWMWVCVDLFFVLSGFLISRIIITGLVATETQGLQGGAFSLRNFIIRRILRIWPVYYITLAACVAIDLIANQNFDLQNSLRAITFLQFTHHYLAPQWNAGAGDFIFAFNHSWSVAIEEQFYLVIPLLMIAFRRKPSVAIGAILSLVPCAVLLRSWGANSGILIARMDALALGVLLAYYTTSACVDGRRKLTISKLTAAFLATTGVVLISLDQFGPNIPPLTVRSLQLLGFNMVFAIFLLALHEKWLGEASSLLKSGVLVFLGSISYALYMVHVPVRGVLLQLTGATTIGDTSPWVVFCYFAVSLVMAYLSKKLIEDPINRLKHRFPTLLPHIQIDRREEECLLHKRPQPPPPTARSLASCGATAGDSLGLQSEVISLAAK